MAKKESLFYKFLLWREKNVKEKNFVLALSFVVGICTAASAILLKYLIHVIQRLLTQNMDVSQANYLLLLYPVLGILLAGLFVKYVVRDDISHGVTKILYAISQRKSRIKPHNMWSSLAASSVTIGFGGSVGAEAPIVLTGAAIGSNLGRAFKMEQKTLMLLVGCGAAGAVAGIFKAPIAGLVFVIEVLMLDLTMTSVMPLLISSVTAATVSYIFTGTEAMFKFSQTEVFEIGRIPYVLLLGVFCGLVSLYFTRVMNRVEGVYRKLGTFWRKFLVGGSMLSILIFLFPPLYGEGYDTIGSLLNGQFSHIMNKSLFYGMNDSYWGVLIFLFLILLTKVFASSATNGGGGCGGIFAPSLFLGCIAGFMFAHTSNYFDFTRYLSEKNFALLGMAGVMSGVMHAPLTGVFLIAELTGGYDLFLPLMIVSISSYLTIIMFEPHSIYSMRLAQKGELLTHHKDKAVLTLLNVDAVIEKDFLTVQPDMTLGDMVKVIAKSGRNAFPVVDKNGILMGIVLLDNIRNIMFRPELYDRFKVSKFMVSPPAKIVLNTSMERVMQIFDDTKAWNLPVIDENGQYIGFMSKSKIFNSYREVLVDHFSND
ncbi:CIC family chloride channel protein [Parabacteroides sp. PF5-5]|uniref:chloride channel protein n=1 Tax=unclassified Parabacteroides TaxID=2649774 RepID=UPI0024765F4E|nr:MULTISPECIES: chloride channel protein [unclassified Parabacteroides]MDH6303869.1 CIC family chloride channel protein [Parabacteroides sp. PH5-39]MDH6314486.1 CIC family chloride channel protein [Parabacteroides sp. PF5-13]MDH6318449.1 CIC family chloride channel protein [Parabacteroides sp. PH5-13]MDH6322258.1 CIC family chloride channel protein [Parabacteroides sp. PH5-8]MDH6325662.1 CIC family chloride channel protein [Parabacteroides sp. PH5-41]